MRVARIVLLLVAGACALAARAATLTNCMELVTYQSRQCYHVVCTNELFKGDELCVDEASKGWSVCCHHTNGWGYVACRTKMPAVSYLDFTNRAYTAYFTTNDFYVAFSWNPQTPTGGLEDYNGWVHLRSPDGEIEIVASALSTEAGERCFYPSSDTVGDDPGDDSADDPVVDPEADKWEWVERNGGIHLTECCLPRSTTTSIVVPSTINGLPVVAILSGVLSDYSLVTDLSLPDTLCDIGADAFRNCVALTQCNIPMAITNVGHGAFAYCTQLASVAFPDAVRRIESMAFSECTSLATADVPFDVGIDADAFPENCKVTCRYPWANVQEPSVRTDVIPSAVSNIEYKAYLCDEEIQSLLIPDWVTNMEYAACYAMMELGAVVIGSGLRTCDSEVFGNCPKLTNVVIRNGSRIVGERMFAECFALKSVTIPPSVREIGAEAFAGCYALKSVTVPLGVQIADNAFPTGCTVTRIGPSVELASCDYNDDRERLMRLVDPAYWSSALKVNLRMETTESEYDLVKRFSFAGISAARYEMQNDGTLVAYFDKPELQIAVLSPTDRQMVVKVSPASGSSIVAPIAIDTAVFVTASDNLADFATGEAKEYCGGYDFDVDTSAYESEGVLRLDLTKLLDDDGAHFFRFALTPRYP